MTAAAAATQTDARLLVITRSSQVVCVVLASDYSIGRAACVHSKSTASTASSLRSWCALVILRYSEGSWSKDAPALRDPSEYLRMTRSRYTSRQPRGSLR